MNCLVDSASGRARDAAMKQIPLTQGKVALVDDEDYPELAPHSWCVHGKRSVAYAARRRSGGGTLLMHRVILGDKTGFDIDHINGNGLDNRKANLRWATRSQNSANRGRNKNNKSGITGVYYLPARWMASIKVNYVNHFLGHFDTKDEAIAARRGAEKRYHGEFVR